MDFLSQSSLPDRPECRASASEILSIAKCCSHGRRQLVPCHQALSQELPSGLATVALNPGIIDTGMLQSTFGRFLSGFFRTRHVGGESRPLSRKTRPRDNGKALTAPQS